jgi:tetratricopeptide (TPR) repeat protein
MGLYLLTSGLNWVWGLVGLAIMIQHFYFTGQRAGMIALAAAAALVIVGWLAGRRVKSPLKGVVVSLAIVAVAGVAGSGGAMVWSKWHGGTPVPLEPSLVIRYQSYISAPNMLFDHPVLGRGPGVYGLAYPEYWTQFEQEWFAQELRMNAHVHNDLMEVAIDGGLLAAGLYLTMLVLGMGCGLMLAFAPGPPERRRLGYAFAALFAAFLVDGLFGFNLRVPVSAGILFVTMGLLEGVWGGSAPGPGVPFRSPRGIRLVAWGAACAAMIFFLALGTQVFAAQYLLYTGMRAQAQNDAVEARSHYERGERMAPWESVFARRLGQLSLAEMDTKRAVAEFDRSIRINPYYILARLPMAQARMLEAQELVQEGTERIPEALQHLDDASNQLDQVLKICPMYPAAHRLLGKIAYISALYLDSVKPPEQQDRITQYWRTAEEHLLFALKYELEKKSELYRTLAKVRIALGNVTGAEQALSQAIQANPGDLDTGPVFLEFAQHHKRYNRFRNALYAQIHSLKEAEEPDLDALATVHLLLANVLENGYDDLEGADAAYLAAVDFGPIRPEVWSNFARYAYGRERLDPLRVAVAQSCGKLEVSNQRPLAHVAAVNEVLQRGPAALENATTLLLSHVRAYQPMGNLTAPQTFAWSAKMLLDAALQAPEDTPGICTACLNLGITLAGLDELDRAQQLFARVKTCLPEDQQPFLAIHWADSLVRQNRMSDALDMLRQAVGQYPANLDVHWALARTYVKTGMIGEAREEYEELLAMPDLDAQGRTMLEQELGGL